MPDVTSKPVHHDIIVIGGGVVGMSIAFRLVKEGREVALIEPNELGMGASYGNAGTIADYATIPVGTPNVLRNLPSLLFDRNSPLSLPYRTLPSLMPWLLEFFYQSLPKQTENNAQRIGALLKNASDMWHELSLELGASHHLHRRGCLYLYESNKAFAAAKYDERLRRQNGVSVDVITADEVLRHEPNLQPFEGGAHFFPDATSIDNPGEVMKIFARNLVERGVTIYPTSAVSIDDSDGTRINVHCRDRVVQANKVIVAAGAFSKPLARSAGETVRLDTERGYHLEFDMDTPPVTRPVCSAKRGFYASPMVGRLRIAGTVELGGLSLPQSEHRLKMLERGARDMFPALGEPSRTWFG
ncbi:MAG: FAD-binding oxidoreductase, partial [Marivivens sp.]|nr:FAD-binding oxidoreductase [Marivivens sp.]